VHAGRGGEIERCQVRLRFRRPPSIDEKTRPASASAAVACARMPCVQPRGTPRTARWWRDEHLYIRQVRGDHQRCAAERVCRFRPASPKLPDQGVAQVVHVDLKVRPTVQRQLYRLQASAALDFALPHRGAHDNGGVFPPRRKSRYTGDDVGRRSTAPRTPGPQNHGAILPSRECTPRKIPPPAVHENLAAAGMFD